MANRPTAPADYHILKKCKLAYRYNRERRVPHEKYTPPRSPSFQSCLRGILVLVFGLAIVAVGQLGAFGAGES